MTDRKQSLTDLLEKVEAGAFTPEPGDPIMPAYRRFVALAENALPQDVCALNVLAYDSYRGSLDAAKALHEAVLQDGEGWEIFRTGKYPGMIPGSSPFKYAARVGYGATFSGDGDNPARAWLIAILKALIAQEGDR